MYHWRSLTMLACFALAAHVAAALSRPPQGPCQSRSAGTVQSAFAQCPLQLLGEAGKSGSCSCGSSHTKCYSGNGYCYKKKSNGNWQKDRQTCPGTCTSHYVAPPPPTPPPTASSITTDADGRWSALNNGVGLCRMKNQFAGTKGVHFVKKSLSPDQCKAECEKHETCKAVETGTSTESTHCELWGRIPASTNSNSEYQCLRKLTDPAVLVETMIETAAVAGGGGTQTVAVVDEIDAFTEQKCPNDCAYGCVMTMEDCEPQPASFGVCLSPEWQTAGVCIMNSYQCSDEDEEEATSSRQLLGAIVNEGRGTFKYYTKVCTDADECTVGAYMGKIETGVWGNGEVSDEMIVQLAEPGVCVTRCQVMELFAQECESKKRSSSRKLLGAASITPTECRLALQGAFDCNNS